MNFIQLRKKMVEEQLAQRDITDPRVLEAMKSVPREEFVPKEFKDQAYWDGPLSIGYGQTISQPYIVALALQLLELKGEEKVLDIGTGSGYEVAILSHLVKEVVSIEIIPQLAKRAEEVLKKLKYDNVKVIVGDGSKEVPGEAPFDVIKSAASTRKIPLAWKKQLKEGGRIVLPLKRGLGQNLVRVTKKGNKFIKEVFASVLYVPLVSGN